MWGIVRWILASITLAVVTQVCPFECIRAFSKLRPEEFGAWTYHDSPQIQSIGIPARTFQDFERIRPLVLHVQGRKDHLLDSNHANTRRGQRDPVQLGFAWRCDDHFRVKDSASSI